MVAVKHVRFWECNNVFSFKGKNDVIIKSTHDTFYLPGLKVGLFSETEMGIIGVYLQPFLLSC